MLGRKQHREGGDDLQRFLRKSIAFILLLIICFNIFVLATADDFSVKRIGNLIPFNDNVFTINAPEKGRLKIKVHDGISVYRTIEQEINKGAFRRRQLRQLPQFYTTLQFCASSFDLFLDF